MERSSLSVLSLALLTALMLVLGSRPASADGPARAREEAQILSTHRAYTEAVKAYDWAEAAKFFDPTALTSIRETMAPLVGMTGDDGKTLADELFGMTAEKVGELDDAGFFGAFMTGVMAMSPGIGEAMAAATMTDKGVAFGESGEAFVVYEMQVSSDEIEMKKLAVTPMVRGADGAWALQMTGEFKGLAEAFERMATQRAAQAEAEAEAGESPGEETQEEVAEPSAPTEQAAPPARDKGKNKKRGKKNNSGGS